MTSALAIPTPAELPRAFGRYQLFDRVGAGGMAEIFLARARTELGGARLVVVKQILPQLSGNDSFADMLITEAKLAAQLNHANIVQVFDLGRHDGVLFIAMEYVEGFDLNELLRRCARQGVALPVEFALLITMEVLRGLSYAHRFVDVQGRALGIVHRDVSPSNVLISVEGEVKLCDFGIARANDAADLVTEDVIKGKAGYMSPEHARGEVIDARADVFSAGIILWELLAGRKLYRGGNGSTLEMARRAQIPPLPQRGLPFESDLHEIVERALARSRDGRYSSAQAMLRELESYVGRAKLMASPIRFGDWLRDNFAQELIASRRARELAAKGLERSSVDGSQLAACAPQQDDQPPSCDFDEPESQPQYMPERVAGARSRLPLYLALGVALGVVVIVVHLLMR